MITAPAPGSNLITEPPAPAPQHCLSQILFFHPGSRISDPDPTTTKRLKKYCSNKFNKTVNCLILNRSGGTGTGASTYNEFNHSFFNP